MFELRVQLRCPVSIGATVLTWLGSSILCESPVSYSGEFLSLSEMLKYI